MNNEEKSRIRDINRGILTAAACFCIFNMVFGICRNANWR